MQAPGVGNTISRKDPLGNCACKRHIFSSVLAQSDPQQKFSLERLLRHAATRLLCTAMRPPLALSVADTTDIEQQATMSDLWWVEAAGWMGQRYDVAWAAVAFYVITIWQLQQVSRSLRHCLALYAPVFSLFSRFLALCASVHSHVKFMAKRERYALKWPLAFWNFFLAGFSIIGKCSLLCAL
jgi:hypothetical protein